MKTVILGKENSVFNEFIGEIRDAKVQKDSMRFRKNLERMGEIFAYEISKKINYRIKKITTPLGVAEVPMLNDKIVVATILRAGLPFHQGFLNYFDKAENAFISAYRKYDKGGNFTIQAEYVSSPGIKNKILILTDVMLATGSSMVLTYKKLRERGEPAHTHIVSVIASKYAVEYTKRNISDKNVTLWLGVVDEKLTSHSYIVPGLGDAGDLAYGNKL